MADTVVERARDAVPSTARSRVNVVLASDRKFLPFCATTIASVLKSSPSEDDLHFYVLTDAPFPQLDAQRFDALRRIRDFSLQQVVVDASQFTEIRTTPGISIATYFRLLMPSVLPADVEKVVYLDCDLVVLDRIRKLYDIDTGDHVFLGVEDSISRFYNAKFGLPEISPHVNGGVLLLNIAALRRIGFLDRVSEYIARHKYIITLGDQEILNTVFHERIGYVHPRWNLHGSMFEKKWRRDSTGVKNWYSTAEMDEALGNPAIIHYTYKRKPWESRVHPRYDVYLEYMKLTDYWVDFEATAPTVETPVEKALRRVGALARKTTKKWAEKKVDAVLEPVVSRRTRASSVRADFGADAAYDHWMCRLRERELPRETRIDEFRRDPAPFKFYVGNASQSDLEAGELSNYKLLFASNRVSNPNVASDWETCDALFLCRWRAGESQQLSALRHAVTFDKPIFFVETSFFAGCFTWANRSAPIELRRPFGFVVDDLAYYYDAARPSRMRTKLHDTEYRPTAAQLAESRRLIDRMTSSGLTKYNSMPSELPAALRAGDRRRVLVVDQTAGDASIELGRASAGSFAAMLRAAIAENPDAEIIVKTHPDSQVARDRGRPGYFGPADARPNVTVVTDSVSPPALLATVDTVYVVTSQLGFEALLHGKRVVCFGEPFYSGLGLTDDRRASRTPSTTRRSIEELFHVSCVEMSHYVDPWSGEACDIDRAIEIAIELRERALRWTASQT